MYIIFEFWGLDVDPTHLNIVGVISSGERM
jgi:hypothetical protein